MKIEDASKENAADLAFLFNQAGEGIPKYLWSEMEKDEHDPMRVGKARAERDEGSFSYKNARICTEDGKLQGMIVSYKQPNPYPTQDLGDYPEVVKPLILLEAKAPGSWYINAIATYEQYQGKGVARRLLAEAQELAEASGCQQMSLIVASENVRAKKLYEYLGYGSIAYLPVVEYPGCLHGGEWQLMVKDIQ